MPILVIDSYDSFTHILVSYFRRNDSDIIIMQNDKCSLSEIFSIQPHAIVISPGPCGPLQAGISLSVIAHFTGLIPILGVCLGHQAISMVFGGRVCNAQKPMHAKVSQVSHCTSNIFHDLPSPMQCMRYHSLAVNVNDSDQLMVLARSEDDEIMALKHINHPVYGLQFHPESILSTHGNTLIKNFINICHQQS